MWRRQTQSGYVSNSSNDAQRDSSVYYQHDYDAVIECNIFLPVHGPLSPPERMPAAAPPLFSAAAKSI